MTSSLPAQDQRLKILWRLAWPAIIEQIMGTLVSFADTAMVGSLGAVATAAVSVNVACLWLVNGIFAGVGVGYSVQVANSVGAGDERRARATIRQGLLAAAAIGVLSLAVLEGLAGFIPSWLGAEPDVYPQAVSYLRFYSLGMPFSTILYIMSPIQRCGGDTKTPLFLNSLCNILNIVFNFFLIYDSRTIHLHIPLLMAEGSSLSIPVFGAGMGVAGAALASAIAQCLAGLLMLRIVMCNHEKPLICSPEDNWKPDFDIIRQATRLGLPNIAERVTVNLGQILMTWIVAQTGTVALAANQIAVNAETICYLPAYGISFAATALVGQAVGAKNQEDARAYGTLAARMSFLICIGTACVLFFGALPLARLFTPDTDVIAETAKVLRIVSVSEPFFALSIVYAGALRGAHDVRCPMFISLGTMWGLRVVLAPIFVFRFSWGLAGVWTAMAIDVTARGLLCFGRWKQEKWAVLSGLSQPLEQPKL